MASYRIKKIVLTALFAAILTGGKMALSFIPNVEIVTLLIMLYSYAFGLGVSLSAALIFCAVEGMLFGFNTWLVSYIIYWPLLAVVSAAVKLIKPQKTVYYIACAAVMTALFGVITSAVDAALASQKAKVNFFIMFAAVYMRGIAFYVTHIVSNIIFAAAAFPVLSKLLLRAKDIYFNGR
ncbi:MAG: hypothetical protein ACOYEC_03955 [Christensenellales bacterium]|nr:hypothetical protein [Clostridiales bacterium]